jgi:acetyl-CoA C-acetyltransferase
MSPDPTRIPVLVGVGQSIEREGRTDVIELAERAARAAFADAPGLEGRIERLSMVGVSFSRVGRAPASEVAERLGLRAVRCEVTTPGGNTPQWLVNRAAREIAAGQLGGTLICGAEATRSMRLADPDADFLSAGRRSANRDANRDADRREDEADPVVGPSVRGLLGAAEIQARLLRPAEIYPVFESVLAARAGCPPAAWREHLGRFLSRFTEVAATNPYAWFQQRLSAEEIARPDAANRLTAEPYTKRMNSFANVDQGAALLVTSYAHAREAGLADRCIFPWSGATSSDVTPAARRDLGASPAIRAAAAAALEASGIGLDEIGSFDLYSCFPVAVEVGAAEIGLALDDPRGLTRTGGLPFFGGPGNDYTSHAIAASVLWLREQGGLAYVAGNGGLLSKHSIGIYGRTPPPRGFVAADPDEAQARIASEGLEVVEEASGLATAVAGTVVYDREGKVTSAPVIATLDPTRPGATDGPRVVANAEEELLDGLKGESLVGRKVRVEGKPPVYGLLD